MIGGYANNSSLLDVYKATNQLGHKAGGNAVTWDNTYPTDLRFHTYNFIRNGTSVSLYVDGVYVGEAIKKIMIQLNGHLEYLNGIIQKSIIL